MKDSWWSPGAVNFTKSQVIWLISNLDSLRQGYWPSEHRETGYSGGKGKSRSHMAYYEKSVQIAAELLRRIEKCWPDSSLLMLSVAYGDIVKVIANGEHLNVDNVIKRIKSALRYISSGKCPRWIDCPGAGGCSQCRTCSRLLDKEGNIKCKKKPRQSKSYAAFKSHR